MLVWYLLSSTRGLIRCVHNTTGKARMHALVPAFHALTMRAKIASDRSISELLTHIQ